MRFDKFSFCLLEIDGSSYKHDVLIDRGESPNARRSRPRNSASCSATRHFPSKKTYPGNPANYRSAMVHTADYP